jgi:hypothetical protein
VGLNAHPEAKRYVIIDDDDDDCLDEFPLFQPSASEGLTPRIAEAAAAYLNGQSNSDMRRNIIVRLFQRTLARLQGITDKPRHPRTDRDRTESILGAL